jgi:AsmA family protein
VLLAGGALWFGGASVVAWAVEHPVSAYIGRQIRMSGPLTLAWGAPTKIIAEDVHVANAPWSRDKEMFSAKRLEIDVFVGTLSDLTRIQLVSFEGGKLLLEKAKDGQKNWNFDFSWARPEQRHQFSDLRRLDVRDAELVYRNDVSGAETSVEITRLGVAQLEPEGPVRIEASGTFQKAPFRLKGSVGPFAALLNAHHPYPIKLEGNIEEVRLALDGTVKQPFDFDGLNMRVSLTGSKLNEVVDMLDMPLPDLPDVRGAATLIGGDAHFSLKALTVKAGDSDLEGEIDANFSGKVPALTANLTSSYIDLAEFEGLYGGPPKNVSASEKSANSATSNSRVLPDAKIAVSKLPGFDADVKFDGARIKSSAGVNLERIALSLRIKEGELWGNALHFHLAQGDVDLNFHFAPSTRDTQPKMQVEMHVRHVDLHQLLGPPTGPPMQQKTAGMVGGVVKIDTTGVSTRQLLAHMDGDANIFITNGRNGQLLEQLTPTDALSALGLYVARDKPVLINCLVSRFAIKQGVATATSLIADTDTDTIVGRGSVNFADETLLLELEPYNKHPSVVSPRAPVKIEGTFWKPTFHIEFGKLIQRVGEALGVGGLSPPAAVVTHTDTGLGHDSACFKTYAAQPARGNPEPRSGSSVAPGTTRRAPPH